jgi:hypothetical protein
MPRLVGPAASCSHDAAQASDSTSSGGSTAKSPERASVTRSASSAGLATIHFFRLARLSTPWGTQPGTHAPRGKREIWLAADGPGWIRTTARRIMSPLL